MPNTKKGWTSVYREVKGAAKLLGLEEGRTYGEGDFVVDNVGKLGSIDVYLKDPVDVETLGGVLERRYGWRAVDSSSDWIIYNERGEQVALQVG